MRRFLAKEVFDIKTLIELYDSCQIENVIAGLSFKPEKIIFVGFKQNMKNRHLNALKKFFEMKQVDVCIEYEYVSRYDYDSIVERLNQILDTNEDCCFDLTGGRELVLVAMGAVSARRSVPIIQFDVKSGDLIRVDNCDDISQPVIEPVSIEECVVLNGGAVVRDTGYCVPWDMNTDFCRDIGVIWDICRRSSAAWNSNSIALATLEKNGFIDKSLRVSCEQSIVNKVKLDPTVMKSLEYAGLIKEYSVKKDYLSFRYKNNQVRQCILKAGNILELLAYMLAHEIDFEEPGFYNDIDVGVIVDWDGIIHEDLINARDTRNEIDVVLMRRHIPIFISCKNGTVQKEALYELQAVAEKFGGKYAKKILLSTYVNRNQNARNFVLQRARDMNIEIIEGVDKMSRDDLKEVLRTRAR